MCPALFPNPYIGIAIPSISYIFFLALIKFSLYTMIKTLANNFDVPIFFVVYTFSLGKKKEEISSENPCLKYNMADVWV